MGPLPARGQPSRRLTPLGRPSASGLLLAHTVPIAQPDWDCVSGPLTTPSPLKAHPGKPPPALQTPGFPSSELSRVPRVPPGRAAARSEAPPPLLSAYFSQLSFWVPSPHLYGGGQGAPTSTPWTCFSLLGRTSQASPLNPESKIPRPPACPTWVSNKRLKLQGHKRMDFPLKTCSPSPVPGLKSAWLSQR